MPSSSFEQARIEPRVRLALGQHLVEQARRRREGGEAQRVVEQPGAEQLQRLDA